jgi:hypothetical protein
MTEFAYTIQITIISLLKLQEETIIYHNLGPFLLSNKKRGLTPTHITRLSWPFGQPVQSGFLPDTSSRRTTPKANTSILSFTLPCMKYSGAKYLAEGIHTSLRKLLQQSKRQSSMYM